MTKKEKIKLAIIGAGRMGITHYSIINTHSDIEIESVADPSALVISMMSKYLPIKTFKDYNDLFDQTSPDAILVCTPPNLHYPIIKRAADKGIHVFVEKPFTTKMKEAEELALLYKEKNLINQVGYVLRYNDCFVRTKHLIDSDVIGKVVRFRSEKFSATITSGDDTSGWRASRESGGGAVFEMASHAIDLVNFILGKPDKVVGSCLTQIYSKNVEDAVTANLIYKDGKTGTIDVNWSDSSYRKPSSKVEILGTGGKIIVNEHSIKIFLNEENKTECFRKGWNTLYITDVFKNVPFYVRGNEFTRQLYDFVDAVSGKTNITKCTFEDGVHTLSVIEDIFKSSDPDSIN